MERIDLFGPKTTRRRSALEAEQRERVPAADGFASGRPTRQRTAGEGSEELTSTRRKSRPRKDKPRKERPRKERPRRDFSQKPVPTVSAREAIFTCLSRREHSAKELRDKLTRQGHEAEAIEEALAYAIEANYQSDARYAASMVRFKGSRIGERKMRMLLATQKIDKATQDDAMAEAEPEIVRAVDAMRSKFERKTPDAALRQKATNFMAGRGFNYGVIGQAWKVVFEDKDIEDYLHP